MKPSKVLIIDDNTEISQFIGGTLAAKGYQVLNAQDAHQGQVVALSELPDLILLDYNLTGKSGLSLLKDPRMCPQMENVPVIMITGIGPADIVSTAVEYGATDFIIKPFDINQMVERVMKLVPPHPQDEESETPAKSDIDTDSDEGEWNDLFQL